MRSDENRNSPDSAPDGSPESSPKTGPDDSPESGPDDSPESGPNGGGPCMDQDKPPVGRILGVLAGLALVVLLVFTGLVQFYKQTMRAEIHAKQLSLESKDLAEARARDQKALTRYGVANARRGFFQIPVEQAMQRLLRHPELIARMPLAKPRPAPLPAGPATNSGGSAQPDATSPVGTSRR